MRTECHLFSGLGGEFCDHGLDVLEETMDRLDADFDAIPHLHGSWLNVLARIVSRARRMGKPDMVILGGHSYGAWKSLLIAQALEGEGIFVDYMACIDATALPLSAAPMNVPMNVRAVDEFWAKSGFPAGARRRDPQGSKGGMYVYSHAWLEQNNRKIHQVPTGHVASALHPMVQDTVLSRVEELMGDRA